MIDKVLRVSEPVTLVGGGALGAADLDEARRFAPVLAAADGGARALLEAGHMPRAVIGDFDSLDPSSRARLPADRLFRIAEQDSTDFEKALARIEAPLVLAVGFAGARMDHQLAALNALVRYPEPPCLIVGGHEVVMHLDRAIEIGLQAGDVVSLFPLAAVTGRSTGLEWPIDGLALAPGGRIGTSNRATGPVRIAPDGPGLVALLPRARLPEAVAAIRARPGAASWRPWPRDPETSGGPGAVRAG